jgi:hypothetical protein
MHSTAISSSPLRVTLHVVQYDPLTVTMFINSDARFLSAPASLELECFSICMSLIFTSACPAISSTALFTCPGNETKMDSMLCVL